MRRITVWLKGCIDCNAPSRMVGANMHTELSYDDAVVALDEEIMAKPKKEEGRERQRRIQRAQHRSDAGYDAAVRGGSPNVKLDLHNPQAAPARRLTCSAQAEGRYRRRHVDGLRVSHHRRTAPDEWSTMPPTT